MTRREFLRLSAVTSAALALLPSAREDVGLALANGFDDNNVSFPVNHQLADDPRAGILQTGLDQIEVAGEIYRPVIDAEALKELILSLALIYHDKQTQEKADRWLDENILEIEVFAPGMLPLASGVFGPPHNGGDRRIGINAEVLKELHFPGSSRYPAIMLAEAVGDLSPETTLPHEIQHFVSWLNHPEDYGGWKTAVTNLSQCLTIPAQLLVALGITNSNLGKKIHRDRRLGWAGTAAVIAYAAGWAFDKTVDLTVDVHGKEKYGDEEIGKLLDEYPQIATLNLQAISLMPV
jgi:hypothetical protein